MVLPVNFVHEFLPRIELTDTTTDGLRVYNTPKGKFRSVTTIIGEKSDKSWLKKWRDRVGDAEADQILHQASVRGTAIHNLAEKYVMNDQLWSKGAMPINVMTFKKIAKILDKHVKKVYGIEFPLFSEMFQTAGRTDLPAQWDLNGVLVDAIVDFKTSRGNKTRDDIHGYFIQATVYALMFEELTGKKMPYLVIVMAIDGEDEARVFVEKCRDWYREVARVFMEK